MTGYFDMLANKLKNNEFLVASSVSGSVIVHPGSGSQCHVLLDLKTKRHGIIMLLQ